MMSRVLTVFLLAIVAPVDAAIVKGTVILNEVGGRPIANVQIIDSAHTGGPWASGSDGGFTLDYPERHAGQRVRIVVNKEGYVVVNDVQLDLALPDDPDANPLQVVICKEDDREEMARRFYRLKSFDAIEETYRKRVKELEDTQQATAAALTKLQQERDQARVAAEKASEELAKNRSGQSSELYQEAKRLFLAGKISEAIKLLGDNDEKRRESVAQAKQAIEQQKKVIENALQEWLLKAQLFTVQFHFDDAETAYREAIETAPDSFQAHFAYARFNQGLNRYPTAEAAYDWCLDWARRGERNTELAVTLNNLGLLDRDQNRMEDARKEFQEALQIHRELTQKTPDVYLFDLAQTLNNLGLLDRDQNRMEDARKEFQDALQIHRQLTQKNPEAHLPKVAQTLNNLGMLDRDQNRMEEARKEIVEALKIRRDLAQSELAQKTPDVYLSDVAETLINLGLLDHDQRRTEEARNDYGEALKTYRELAQKTPDVYLPDVAQTLNNLGILDRDQKRMEEARKEIVEALKIRRDLAQKNPDVYLPDVAQTLNNLGILDRDQKRMEDARNDYAEALKIRRELAQKNPDVYLPKVALALNNLGILDRDQKRMEEARNDYAEALKIYRELAQKNPDVYPPKVALALNNLGILDRDQKRMEEARKEIVEALKIYRELAQKNPDVYLPDVAETLNNLGLLDRDQNRMEEAHKEIAEALGTYRELAQKNPEIYLPDVTQTLNNLGLLDQIAVLKNQIKKNAEGSPQQVTAYVRLIQLLAASAIPDTGGYTNELVRILEQLRTRVPPIGKNEFTILYQESIKDAASLDVVPAIVWLAENEKLSEASDLFLRAAKLGDSYAMMKLGRLYLRKGTAVDHEEGFRWLEQAYAAPKPNLEAGAFIADCYLSGNGTTQDVQKAEEAVMPLANQGVVPAMTLAGRILLYKAVTLRIIWHNRPFLRDISTDANFFVIPQIYCPVPFS